MIATEYERRFGVPGVPAEDRERAALARVGGRQYTRAYAARQHTQPGLFLDRGRMAEIDRWVARDAASLLAGESYYRGAYSQPHAWTDTEGNAHLTPAMYWAGDHVMSPRSFTITVPEAALDWPVYRVATGRGTPTLTCACGHLFVQHQTGDGPWTGFCGGQVNPDDPEACDCEGPVAPERHAADLARIAASMATRTLEEPA